MTAAGTPARTSAAGAPVLRLRGIRKSFDATPVLHGVELDVAGGEILALLGENGAGKSTLLNVVAGALQPDAGTIELEGVLRHWRGPRAAIDAGIAFVHQELSVVRSLSVAENILLGDYAAGRSGFIRGAAMRARARATLDEVGARHIRPEQRMDRLGIADQQMVEIAKALIGQVRLLIMDEPTSSLTPHEAEALFAVIRRLRDRGVAIILTSHRLEEVFALADRIVVLRDGRLVSDRPATTATRDGVILEMSGRSLGLTLTRPKTPAAAPAGAVVLAVDGIADARGVGPVRFDLHAGEVLGVFGLVGAGRSTLLRMLSGAHPVATGLARYPDGGGLPRTPREAWARGAAILPEDRKAAGIAPSLSVQENALLSRRQRGPAWLRPGRERREAATWLQSLAVRAARVEQSLRTLSGGNQQKVILARCLATSPRLLLLDEPTRGVDVHTKAQIYEMIRRLAADGLAVLFASSELPEILALSDTVLVLAKGRQTLLAANRDLAEERILQAAFAFA